MDASTYAAGFDIDPQLYNAPQYMDQRFHEPEAGTTSRKKGQSTHPSKYRAVCISYFVNHYTDVCDMTVGSSLKRRIEDLELRAGLKAPNAHQDDQHSNKSYLHRDTNPRKKPRAENGHGVSTTSPEQGYATSTRPQVDQSPTSSPNYPLPSPQQTQHQSNMEAMPVLWPMPRSVGQQTNFQGVSVQGGGGASGPEQVLDMPWYTPEIQCKVF